MSGELIKYLEKKEELNSISPSFCTAKWSQVTMHLHNGRTHSCHHPSTHLVPLDELKENPTALHNTNYKKEQRKKMLEGKRPEECQYCWNVEDLPDYNDNNYFSDRVTKSDSPWSTVIQEEAATGPWDQNINPTYIEVSFSNLCNFKCSYCSPVYSSTWETEINEHGPYPTSHSFNSLDHYKRVNEMPINHKEQNPYVDAFWEWWPDLVGSLKIFRVTGGEPLLHKDTYKILDYLYEHPQPDLELSFNTNAGIADSKLNTFISKLGLLIKENKIKKTHIYTSVDSAGKQAEYGRHGLDYNKWVFNIDKILTELPETKITIMCTTNILSITNYQTLLEDLLRLKKAHINDKRLVPITLDVAILRHPQFQCAAILTKECHNMMDKSLEFMRANQEGKNGNDYYQGFFDFEISKLERFISFMKSTPPSYMNVRAARKDFYTYMNEHDRRRGTNFLETFPELKPFYDTCRDF